MEIKAVLNKPFSNSQRIDFIVTQNHNNGYEIRETANTLEAWGYTEAEIEELQRKFINNLKLSKREVFLALNEAKGITPDEIKSKISEPTVLIEFEYANDYYRGNPLVETIGKALGFTSEQLDYLFQYKKLPPEVSENA